MGLVLIDLKSQQQIELDAEIPLIIGRKTVQECNDKRVSRNHGKVKCTQDGKLILSALHSNPCFFTRNGVPPVLQINKNEEQVLNVGDCLGLLPDSFWFQVTAKKNYLKTDTEILNPTTSHNDSTSSDILFKEENCTNKTVTINKNSEFRESNSLIEDKSLNRNGSPSKAEISNLSPNTGPSGTTGTWGYGNPEFEKTKRLPLWMYDIDEPKDSGPKKAKIPVSPKKVNSKKIKLETDKNCKVDESVAKLKNDVAEKGESSHSSFNTTDNFSLNTPSTSGCHDSLFSVDSKENNNSHSNDKDGCESDVKEVLLPGNPKRPICQYEENCYRKNPQHKLDFCHPGDADFVPYENRPMCQYGASCYRTNKRHLVELRHPTRSRENNVYNVSSSSSCPSPASSPLPAKRRRKKVKRHGVNSEDEDDDENSYDLEDPFIDDASSDEYVPVDSDADEESDVFDA